MPTLAQLKSRVLRSLKEDEDPELLEDLLNDAIESLWESIILINVQSFMEGPVQNISFATGDERATLISVDDPTVAPVANAPVAQPNNLPSPRDLYFSYTYVTESGSETLPSPKTHVNIPVADQLASIAPPQVPSLNPVSAIGWNLYASDNPNGRMALQNEVPLGFSTSWQEDEATGVLDDPNLPAAPIENNTADNIFYIKVLQVQNFDQTWTTWTGADIDGLLFSRANRDLPVASTYQSYAWDVLRNRQIEIRPKAGMQLDPRYFFVAKPRRLRFDNAQSPFTNLSHEEFLVNRTVSRVKLTNEEYQAHQFWEELAESKRMSILQAVSDQMVTRQQTIIPFFRY